MARTLQFRRLSANTLANTTGAAGELIVNTNNYTLTVHDGSLPGGYPLLNASTDTNIDQYARNTANTASANTVSLANTTISISTLKALTANAATYAAFQSAIAAL